MIRLASLETSKSPSKKMKRANRHQGKMMLSQISHLLNRTSPLQNQILHRRPLIQKIKVKSQTHQDQRKLGRIANYPNKTFLLGPSRVEVLKVLWERTSPWLMSMILQVSAKLTLNRFNPDHLKRKLTSKQQLLIIGQQAHCQGSRLTSLSEKTTRTKLKQTKD